MKENLLKAVKEFLRVVVLAIIPLLIVGLQEGSLDIKLVIIAGAVAGLRFIDKLLHEMGKESDNGILLKGLTRF